MEKARKTRGGTPSRRAGPWPGPVGPDVGLLARSDDEFVIKTYTGELYHQRDKSPTRVRLSFPNIQLTISYNARAIGIHG